jgi:transglutaminase-like putative cysteine protease
MDYENARCELQYEDQNHNTVTLITVNPGATEVSITCSGTIETQDNAGVIGRHSGHLPLWSFLGQTELTRPGPRMKALSRGLDNSEAKRLEFLHELSGRILESVEYKPGTTGVGTTGEEAAEAGSGVCQDHAHIFIGAARLAGIPARYVSGYLMMNDRIDQEATHAWAEAHVEGLGWVGFDVSNGISPDPRYVRVATGRDYRDAAPITGITFGAVTEDLQVDLAVEQQQSQQ